MAKDDDDYDDVDNNNMDKINHHLYDLCVLCTLFPGLHISLRVTDAVDYRHGCNLATMVVMVVGTSLSHRR